MRASKVFAGVVTGIFSGGMAAAVQAGDVLEKADLAYGEYLSGECVTCHRADGADEGIPSITGLDAEGFASIMHAYRDKDLDNKVMQMIAGRLDAEQIASLAVYFASLPAAE